MAELGFPLPARPPVLGLDMAEFCFCEARVSTAQGSREVKSPQTYPTWSGALTQSYHDCALLCPFRRRLRVSRN